MNLKSQISIFFLLMEAYIIYKVLLKTKIKLKTKNGIEKQTTNKSPKISSERSCVCLVRNVPFVMKMESKLNMKYAYILLLLCYFLIDSGPRTLSSSSATEKKQRNVVNAK